MIAPWAREEVENVNLNDKRLNQRLAQILSDLGEHPTASIPAACGGHNETSAAYRFFDNDKVTYDKVLQPHYDCTRQRLAAHKVGLLIQDTTELDLTRPQQQVEGAGPMNDSARRGAFAHIVQAFTTDGTPLGAVWADLWARDDDDATPQEKKQWRREAGIEEKERFRWLEGVRQSRAVAQALPDVCCVCVGDSEADIYELFAEPRGEHPVPGALAHSRLPCRSRPTVAPARGWLRRGGPNGGWVSAGACFAGPGVVHEGHCGAWPWRA